MDYIRFALISALAIVSYLLLLAWNEDYPAQVATPPAQTQTTAGVDSSADLPSDLPQAPQTPAADIPPAPQQPGAAGQTQGQANAANFITVSTPVQVLTIDLVGGDIVSLSLPDYPVSLDAPDVPFQLLQSNGRVYVAQSGLIGPDGPDGAESGRPLYQSELSSYTLSDADGTLSVDLRHVTQNGVSITKRFTFSGNDYLIDVEYLIENGSGAPFNANLFGQIKRDGSGDPSSTGRFGVATYLGAALTVPGDDNYKKVDFDDINRGGTRDVVTGGWIAFSQHYFLSAWIPDPQVTHTYTTRRNNTGEYIMGFVSPGITVAPGANATVKADFWAGPKDQERLQDISEYLGLTIDYGFLWFIAYPIYWLLTRINSVIGNYGWSIIALTVLIKLLFLRLSAASYRSMAKMRRLTPQIAAMRERFGDDKQKLMQAQMELWRKEKVNPMGGCLPMLLQMPVLLGIYWVLNESVELRHADWILWYSDLSAMDPYFVLPLIMGASMFVSQLMTPMTTADPMQAKIMRFMPVLFTVFFLWFPAGLVLYWLISNVFNIAQQWYVNKKVDESYKVRAS